MATPELEIRRFEEADRAAVVALWTNVFSYPAPHNDPGRIIDHKLALQRELFFVAVLEGRLIGTVMGMIALLGTLGQEGAEAKIGPAMSVAMSATLYGVVLANMVILPVADNLLFRTQKMIAKREMIIEGILMIRQQMPPVMIREILLSHLSPHQRLAFKRVSGGQTAGAKAA